MLTPFSTLAALSKHVVDKIKFVCSLELSAALIDPNIRDLPHLWIVQSILLNLANPSRSC